VARRQTRLERAVASLGGTQSHPFMILAFLPLSVLPALRITDRGLVDVQKFQFVPVQ
jgi:adenine deaminase